MQPRQRLPTIQFNNQRVVATRRETLLETALRSGLDFPNGCRVGGCGACKCRLTEGAVHELTETGYLLSAEEIANGYILACQAVPRSDVRVEVELAGAPCGQVRGRIVEQAKVTHDITRLRVELETPVPYKAGQFAALALESQPEVERSYSFATPFEAGAPATFYIRKVPGGLLSSKVHDEALLGQRVRLRAPAGDFWLRPSAEPMLLVGGGSGLAPLLALLEDAHRTGAVRDVTLLFGAREQRDLYAVAEIEALASAWRGSFRFVPVLSAASEDETWAGARGLVSHEVAALVAPGTHAYLCGPPPMVDAVVEVLRSCGVGREHIHFDRFTTRADTAAAPESGAEEWAGVLHYAKFFSFHVVGALALAALFLGGRFTTAGLLAVLAFYMLGDAALGDDTSTPKFRYPAILTVQLWIALPLLAGIVFAAIWSVCVGDPLGIGSALGHLTGRDLLAAREATSFGHHVSGWVLTGLMIGMVGTIPGHELTHRTWDRTSMLVGRWLLAFSFDTSFAVEHVYGHHRYVSTVEDPATAPRGRNVYAHIVISTIRGNLSAWKIESERLRKKGRPVVSIRNAVIRGYLMSATFVALAFAMGGLRATAFFLACALWGKALLEIVNYMEHYGIVRDPATPVQPRHSWNTTRRVSSWTMFNLTRHSHHHAQGEVAYQDLRPYADAPMMINGYLTTLVVALLPPLWHALMTPKVLAWDRDFATHQERALAARANARSGLARLTQLSPSPLPASSTGHERTQKEFTE